MAYKKRKRRHKTKWNYKRIAIAFTGLAAFVVAATVLISVSGKDKSGGSSYNNGIVADAAQNKSDKKDNLSTVPQQTDVHDKQNGTSDNTNAVSNNNVNIPTQDVDTPKQNVNPANQAGNNDMTSKTSKGYSITEVDGITYVDGVLIVNKTYALPEDYNPGAVDGEVMEAFSVMQNAAAREGLNIYISSGFRSYETQNRLYNNYVAKDGKAEADRYSARAGHSEHQTGLCFDLNSIDDSFAATPEGEWVANHAWEYGFIIRYPKGKEDVTGYMYESWHLRYLGKELAKKVYDSGLCLEEYYGITSQYE